jgi:hypothetical protein
LGFAHVFAEKLRFSDSHSISRGYAADGGKASDQSRPPAKQRFWHKTHASVAGTPQPRRK